MTERRQDDWMLDYLLTEVGPRPWASQGNCVGSDTNVFFPSRGGTTKEAKAICDGCPVMTECLEYALEYNERIGTWGGKSAKERRIINQQRRRVNW